MSTDPATFVAGVPVKISEKYRPPRKVSLPASCQHQINPELLTQDYDFAVEKTTLIWVQERRNRIEKEERMRRERIAEYEKKKAELKAKQETEEKLKREKELLKQEEETERLKKEEEERIKREEEEEIRRLEEEINQEQQTQDTENAQEAETGDVKAIPASQIHDANGNEAISPGVVSQGNEEIVSQEAPQTLSTSTLEDTSYCGAISNANSVCKPETNVSSNTTSYDLMLKPTPIPSQKSVRSPSKTPANINFADFEGEGNDPFDSAALKSINDMEELAKVLDSSHISPKPVEGTNTQHHGPSKEGQSYPNTYPNGQIAYGAFGQYPYFMPSQQQPQQQSLQQQNLAHPRPGFPHYGNHLAKNPQVTRTSSTPSSVSGSQYTKDPGRTFQNKYYPQPWNSGYTVNSPSKTAQFVPYDYCLQSASIANSVSNTTQGGVMSPSNKTGNTSTLPIYTSGGCSTVQSVERGTAVSKRQDLEDFYSKYYSQSKSHVHQNQQSGLQSGESTPSHSSSSGAAGSTSGSLRSCRSVPDLTAAEDSEVTRYSSGLQSHNDSRGVSHTPPPRPSSTGLTGLEDWKPLPDISGLAETSSSQHLYQSSPVQHPPISSPHTPIKSRLPDPFAELTTDAQALVQNMAEMGFPRPRVARAVQKLGTDHKKLIEVLLVLQSLQGNGEDGYKAERAFYHYMGDVQKTKDHLAAAKQLLDLGFEEEQVVDALLKHDNDRDKALEELIA